MQTPMAIFVPVEKLDEGAGPAPKDAVRLVVEIDEDVARLVVGTEEVAALAP